MKLIFISLYLLFLSNVLSNKVQVNSESKEINFEKIDFLLNKEVIRSYGGLENHKHINNFDFNPHKVTLTKNQFHPNSELSFQSNFLFKNEKNISAKNEAQNKSQTFDFSFNKENLKQNEIHLNTNKNINQNNSILSEKNNKNLKEYSENSVLFDFSIRKESLRANQIHLESKSEALDRKENKENLSLKNSNALLNNKNKNVKDNEKTNDKNTLFGNNIFNFRLSNEHLTNKQFHPFDALKEETIGNKIPPIKEEKIVSNRLSEKANKKFNFEMLHERLSKRQFHPELNKVEDLNGSKLIENKQENAVQYRKESENFDFHLNHESLNKSQFHPQLRVNRNEIPASRIESKLIKEQREFDFHLNHDSLTSKQFHPQLRISSENSIGEKGTSRVSRVNEIKEELPLRINENFDFHLNNEHLSKKQFNPELRINTEEKNNRNTNENKKKDLSKNQFHPSLRIIDAPVSTNNIENKVETKIEIFDFHFNNEHLSKKQFHPSLRIVEDPISPNNIKNKVENKIENFDFHFNNEHLNKKQFHPSMRIVEDPISINNARSIIENKNENFDFHLNHERLNKKQFHPSMRIENDFVDNNNNINTKKANSLITINSERTELPKAKEEVSNFDFHFRKERLSKENFHPSAAETNSISKPNEKKRELVVETPLIKTIKSRVESHESDFHLNHESLNKNQIHPFIEAKTEGRKDSIKKIKQSFDFHFRKESLNKAQYHPENLVSESKSQKKINSEKTESAFIAHRENQSLSSENKIDFGLIREKLNNKQLHPQVINFAKEQLREKANRNNGQNNSELIALVKENKNKLNFDFGKQKLDQAHFHPTVDQISVSVPNEKTESLRKANNFDFHFNHEKLNNKQFHPNVNRIVDQQAEDKNNQSLNFNLEFRKKSLNQKQYHLVENRISEEAKENKIEQVNKLDFSFRKEQLAQKEFHPSLIKEERKTEVEKPIIKKEEVIAEAVKPKKPNLRGSIENKNKKEENKSSNFRINFDLNEIEFSKEQIMKNPQFLRTFFGVDSTNKKPVNKKKEENVIPNIKNKDKITITVNRVVENSNSNSTQNNSTSTEKINKVAEDDSKKNNKDETKDSQKDVVKINNLTQEKVQNDIVNIVQTPTVIETVIPTPTIVHTPVIDIIPVVDVIPTVDTVVLVEEKKDTQSNANISIKEESQDKEDTEKEINNSQNATKESNSNEEDPDTEKKKDEDIVVNEPALEARQDSSFRRTHLYDYLTIAHELEIEF